MSGSGGPQPGERLVDLRGLRPGDATELILGFAQQLGYTAGASAPGTYRLARTRRRLVGKRTDEFVVTVFEDRSGTRARFVGDVDPVVFEHLGPHAVDAAIVVAPAPVAAPQPSVPASVPLPQAAHRPSMAPAPAGVIGAVPGVVPSLPRTDPANHGDVDARTMVRRRGRSIAPTLTLPDGRSVELDRPVVIGREPDAERLPGDWSVIAVSDRSLSKTHASVEAEGGVVTVVDLHSTNGTSIRMGNSVVACTPGEPVQVPAGAVIVVGAIVLEVDRS